ncbi:MAG: 30S ribosomal protein S9 [Candidatus Kapaibacteriales bacterium]
MKVYQATGRRKTSVAQVRLTPGSGKVLINGREADDYIPVELQRKNALSPLKITENDGNYDVSVTVRGGGLTGQTGAIRLGISRALVDIDEELKPTLKKAGFLTRDPRIVERKKYGFKKARKRFQFSKR